MRVQNIDPEEESDHRLRHDTLDWTILHNLGMKQQ